jgi:predicted dehydrogenase
VASDKKLVVGLIGCGNWGKNILRDLLTLDVEVHVVVVHITRTPELLAMGANKVTTNIDDLSGVDGIVVATPVSTRAEVIGAALNFDVPVFTEKPLTDNLVAANKLATLAPNRLFVMDKWRYHPGVLTLKELVNSGKIGKPLGIRTTRTQWGSSHVDPDCTWMLLPHDLSIALEIFGAIPEAKASIAWLHQGLVVGLIGHLNFSDNKWMSVEVGVAVPGFNRRVEIVGEESCAVLAGGWVEEVIVTPTKIGSDPISQPVFARGELPLMSELRAFVEHLRGGPPPVSSVQEGMANVRAISDLRTLAGLPQ